VAGEAGQSLFLFSENVYVHAIRIFQLNHFNTMEVGKVNRSEKNLIVSTASIVILFLGMVLQAGQDSDPGTGAVAGIRFDFGSGPVSPGFTPAGAGSYDEQTGYGFLSDSLLSPVTVVDRGGSDALLTDFCTSEGPFYFMVDLPEGNYRMSLTSGDYQGSTQTTVKAELRRLMIESMITDSGQFKTETFLVNVRTPVITPGSEVSLKDREKTLEHWAWDKKLTLEFNGDRPVVCSLEIVAVDNTRVIYLLGDSTVCDQPVEPYSSWGQMLTRFFKPEVVIANHAESGASYQSAIDRGRFDKIMSLIRPNDVLILQFGHNDMKLKGEGIGPFTSFAGHIRYCVAETRRHGGIPVLVTPVQRRNFDDEGKIVNSHGDYPAAVRQVARDLNVPLIDLHAMSAVLYEALGPEDSVRLFSIPEDRTHHNNYGSYQLAKCVIEGIRENHLEIASSIIDDCPVYDPAHPDPPETWHFPASPAGFSGKPDGS
jgi:lysophospholipase L1-like esterase